MTRATRKAKSYTIDDDILKYVAKTRGKASASERVNRLLKRAMLAERYEALEREAADFFASESVEEHSERKAFQTAALPSLGRD